MKILVMSRMRCEEVVSPYVHDDKAVITDKSPTISPWGQSMSVDFDGRFSD